MAVNTHLAVDVKNVKLSYGFGIGATHVLRGLNLEVPEGVIYGLLGPSGCGKTTLLRCIVGRINPRNGLIRVFGSRPGCKTSCVPGRGIGYMPQELALYEEFSIEENLAYFGSLQRLSSAAIKDRTAFLLKLLDLPDKQRLIKTLSGGQKRRISLAVALIHQPPLLILDEPTVGVDPLLRSSIWNHLVTVSTEEKITVIVTTHYIEEANKANVVGLMRNGKLLGEDSPCSLMEKWNQPSMERVFLALCHQEEEDGITEVQKNQGKELNYYPKNNSSGNVTRSSDEELEKPRKTVAHLVSSSFKSSLADSASKIAEVSRNNLRRIRRNLIYSIFNIIFPALQAVIFFICLGGDPHNLSIAVVNEEHPSLLGKMFLDGLDSQILHQKSFDNLTLAKLSVQDGYNWGTIHIRNNFSTNLLKRFQYGLDADNATIDASTVRVYLDMSNQQIGYIIQRTILKSFQNVGREMLISNGSNPELANSPVSIEQPIYGNRNPNFVTYAAPGIIIILTAFMSLSFTTMIYVTERKNGLLDRAWVSGVTPLQILISHILSSSIIMTLQTAIVFLFSFFIYNIPSRGPMIWVMLLTLLQGVWGLSGGLFISAVFYDERTSLMLVQGMLMTSVALSGIIWPVECMPYFMRLVSNYLPQTLPVAAIRVILTRGWDVTHNIVWSGYLITVAWTLFFFVASAVVFKIRK